jgi:hypothetical protein
MPVERARRAVLVAVALALTVGGACTRPTGPSASSTVAATANPVAPVATAPPSSVTPSPTPTATALATPVAGGNIKVGDWTVTVVHFRAQVSEPDGVNIRSSPEVKPDNRTGSLPAGATVDIEGTTQGQEAIAGQGANWYYLGTVGASPPSPQFVYGPAGTLTQLSASATPSATSPATPSVASAATPQPTSSATVTPTP